MHTHLPFRSTILAAMTAVAFVGMPLAGCAEKDKEDLAREQRNQTDHREIRGTIVRVDAKNRVAGIEMDAADATAGRDARANQASDIRLDPTANVTIDGQRRDFADLKNGDRFIATTAQRAPGQTTRGDDRAQAVSVTEIRVFRDQQIPGKVDRDHRDQTSRDDRAMQGDRRDQPRRDAPAGANPAGSEQDLEWKKQVDTPKTPVGDPAANR